MSFANRFALLGALLIVSACARHDVARDKPRPVDSAPVPDTVCEYCRWANFTGRPLRVWRIECTYEDKPDENCHLQTEKGKPERVVYVNFDQSSGAYSVRLESPDKEEAKNRMVCENVAPDPYNKRVIEGTCLIYNSDQGPEVHFFRGTVSPNEKDPSKASPHMRFQHKPFSREPAPVHEGDVHFHDEFPSG
jgi:hypothetical protein